jgi:hypothetical protein
VGALCLLASNDNNFWRIHSFNITTVLRGNGTPSREANDPRMPEKVTHKWCVSVR